MTTETSFFLSEKELTRIVFEGDAIDLGLDITRNMCAAPEPWSEYESEITGHRWGGWLAAKGIE